MSGSVHIRRGSAEDAVALAELAARTFRDTFEDENTPADMEAYVEESFSPQRVRQELEDPDHIFLLAFLDSGSSPIGYAGLRAGAPGPSVRGPQPVELRRIYVRRKALGRGVGAALMRACLDEASREGHEALWLGVWERNRRAIAFYRRWHFEVVGSQPFLLGSDRQNDLIMVRPVGELLR